MLVEFQLPNIGEGVDSADVAEILIAEGQTLNADQVVMELETDKAVVELPCPHGGTVRELLIGEGDTIAVGQTLFTVETDNGASPPATESAEAKETQVAATDAGGDGESELATTATTSEAIEFALPSLGEGIESAEVAEIHVAAGESVAAEQVVMELETDKAVVELPCPHAGTIRALHVSAGDTIQVGQPLLTLDAAMEEAPRTEDSAPPSDPITAVDHAASDDGQAGQPTPSRTNDEPGRSTSVARVPEIVDRDETGRPPIPAAPSTRRLARQLGVNLREVNGSGPGGRITQEDVQEFVKDRLTTGLPAVSSGDAVSILAAGSLAPPPLPDFSKFGTVDREKMSKLARTAAENLSVSWNVIPHVMQHDRADVTELEAARKKFAKGAGAGRSEGDHDGHRDEGAGNRAAAEPEVQQQSRPGDTRDRLQAVLPHRLRGRHTERSGRAGRQRRRPEEHSRGRRRDQRAGRVGP